MAHHLTLTDRAQIEMGISSGLSISEIATELGKNRSTISREIKKHLIIEKKGVPHRIKNNCLFRKNCSHTALCVDKPDCTRRCSTCGHCNSKCPEYREEICPKLSQPPYVCNGCSSRTSCVLTKHIYSAKEADAAYNAMLVSAREGYNLTTLQLRNIDQIVSPLLKQGQSIHHIYTHNEDALPISESTISRLVKDNNLTATVMDQQRVVKLKPRKSKPREKKIDRHCREGRTIQDFRNYMEAHSFLQEVQMDSVIGRNGGKCLLTMHLPKADLTLAFLCDSNTAANVQHHIDSLYAELQSDFSVLFPVLLTDNGSEFSNPAAIETSPDGTQRTKVFYCDPQASWQKGAIERNHEFIRLILPKGTSFDSLTPEKVGLMMSHINSYSRKSLGDKSPYEVFSYLYGPELLEKLLHLLCQKVIPPSEIVLKPSLLKD